MPASFFYHGWHLALEPSEVALILAIAYLSRVHRASVTDDDAPAVSLAPGMRWALYGISGEAYNCVHELEEFGVISISDPMPSRRHGKLRPDVRSDSERSLAPEPYRFAFHPKAFDEPALTIITDALAKSNVPPRFI